MYFIPNDRNIRNDLALKNYFKANLQGGYAIKTHSHVYIVLTLSALPEPSGGQWK